jgi:hypothetical protein
MPSVNTPAPPAPSTSRLAPAPPRLWSRGTRRALLTLHIVASVGLLGASSALLVLAITASGTNDPDLSHSAATLVRTFGFVFGIPLSFTGLLTGIALGLGTKWGVLRYPWVMTKLALLVTTILSGALLIGTGAERMIDGEGGGGLLIAAASYNVCALLTSTVLSVYKPGRKRRRA